ncbi:hypothetical protein Q2941_12200 [Bradyrhizobium sp. UFLA05-153]
MPDFWPTRRGPDAFSMAGKAAHIRVPYELLDDYCDDYDKATPGRSLSKQLRAADWYEHARAIRHTVSQNFRFDFSRYKPENFPITWSGISMTPELHEKASLSPRSGRRSGYEFFVAMRSFAKALPEPSIT